MPAAPRRERPAFTRAFREQFGLAPEAADASNFERYTEAFDPRTGLGGVEIWIPLKS